MKPSLCHSTLILLLLGDCTRPAAPPMPLPAAPVYPVGRAPDSVIWVEASAQDLADLMHERAVRVANPAARPRRLLALRYHAELSQLAGGPLRLGVYAVDARTARPRAALLTELVILCLEKRSGWHVLDLQELAVELPAAGAYLSFTPILSSAKFYCWPLATEPRLGSAQAPTGPFWSRKSKASGYPADTAWQPQPLRPPGTEGLELIMAAP